MRVFTWVRCFLNVLEAAGVLDPSVVLHIRAARVRGSPLLYISLPPPRYTPAGPLPHALLPTFVGVECVRTGTATPTSAPRDHAACPCVEPAPRQEHSTSPRFRRRAVEADDR